jgi:hypothetical protein
VRACPSYLPMECAHGAGSFLRPPSLDVVQPAKHGEPRDRASEPDRNAFTRNRNPLVDPLVGPSGVEEAQRVFGEDVVQLPLGEDEQMIEALAAHAPEKSLSYGVHERCLHRSAHDARRGALGDTVEHRTKLVVAGSSRLIRPVKAAANQQVLSDGGVTHRCSARRAATSAWRYGKCA